MTPNPSTESSATQVQKSLSERLTLWIGILGSIITISLTIVNTHTKNAIDQMELTLRGRAESLEEAKAHVEVYKWVYTLLPGLEDKDEKKRTLTINMINLALQDDAQKFFAGLQTSNIDDLRLAGQSGLTAVQSQSVAALVNQLNASDKQMRVQAGTALQRDYLSSPVAINLVLHLYDQERIQTLSADGLINGLYYLNRTDAAAWNPQLVQLGKGVKSRIDQLPIGAKTRAELANFEKHLTAAEKGQ
jgi:hypothetical protein